jgi:DegV family protein with EDD domain
VAVAVVTDTTHYLPPEVVAHSRLHCVSLYVNWDGRTERESEMPDFAAFYRYLASGRDLPTTSQPSLGDFLDVYRPLIAAGEDILSVHLSSGLSGTFAAAEQARALLLEAEGVDPARILVLDSETTCGGTGLMLIAAANAAAAGAGVHAAAERAMALRRELQVRFAVADLEYLRRGGRIGMAQAWLGSALKVKPILTLEHQVEPIERVRTWSRAFDRLLDHLRERFEQGHDTWFVQHIRGDDELGRMVERGTEIFGRGPEFVSEIGPVVGTHTGPGLLGVAAIRRDLLGPAGS